MNVSADEIAAHGDKDHGVGDIDAFFVIAHEAPPAVDPAEGALHQRLYNVAKCSFGRSVRVGRIRQEAEPGI